MLQKSLTIRSAYEYIKNELKGIYSSREIEHISHILLETLTGLNFSSLLLNREEQLNEIQYRQLEQFTTRLKEGVPVQHIIGHVEFYGLKLKVSQEVLIPRPETEELVDWILEKEKGLTHEILDIGTGSGCIALVLKKNIPGAAVSGTDVSEKALKIAASNAQELGISVRWIKNDVLKEQVPLESSSLDLIVSNPPYVKASERKIMDRRVYAHEPAEALFVPDKNPLIIYKAVVNQSLRLLNNHGRLYFEIHEESAGEICQLLSARGFASVTVKKDMHEKDRMIRAVKST